MNPRQQRQQRRIEARLKRRPRSIEWWRQQQRREAAEAARDVLDFPMNLHLRSIKAQP